MKKLVSSFFVLILLLPAVAQQTSMVLPDDIVLADEQSFISNSQTDNRSSAFIANYGQVSDFKGNPHPEFLFYFQSEGLDVYFRKEGVTYIFKDGERPSSIQVSTKDDLSRLETNYMNDSTYFYRMDVNFVQAGDHVDLYGEGRSSSLNHYYYPNCPDGILNVPAYASVRYSNVYEGIDFVYYLKDGKLKYDIVVNNPNALDDIALEFKNINNLIQEDNAIFFQTETGILGEALPETYLLQDGKRDKELNAEYVLSENIVRFVLKETIKEPFVIDPVITWTTYYDDSFWNGSNSRIDAKGNQVVIVSYGFSSLFPLLDAGSGAYFQNSVAGSGDYRILKFDSNAVRIWATYYGGSGYENTADVVIDYNGNIILTGQTESTDIPVQSAGGYYDANYNAGTYGGGTFVAKFNSAGVRQWGTHYDFIQYPMVEVDHNNNIYVVAQAEYDDPPVLSLSGAYNQALIAHDGGGTNNSDDIFIVKFNSSTARTWATNLGSSTDEVPVDIVCGSDNYLNILAISDCYSGTGLLTQNPGSGAYYDNTTGPSSTNRDDILLYRFNSAGALFWGTAFGCTANDNAQQGRIAADNLNNIYIFSEAANGTLPLMNPGGGAYYDGTHSGSSFNPFIAKFSSGGVLTWSTFFGTTGLGFGMNFSNFLGFNNDNNLVAVLTDNGGIPGTFPLVPRAGDYNATMGAYMGVYIAEFDNNLGIAWSTFYSGTTDRHTLGDAVLASDACGYQIYMTTNWEKYNASAIDPPWEKPIPTTYQNTVFDLVSSNHSGLITRFGTKKLNATITPAGPFCSGDAALTLTAATSGGTWSGTGITNAALGTFDPVVAGAGTHEIIYSLAGPCGDTDTTYIIVTANADATIAASGPFCLSDAAVSLSAATAGGTWSGTGITNASSGTFDPATAGVGSHEIVYAISGSCSDSDTINITVNAVPGVGASASASTICSGSSTDISASGATTYQWSHSLGINATNTVSPTTTTIYSVTGTSGGCTNSATVTVTVNPITDAAMNASGPFCISDAATTLTAVNAGGTWAGTGITNATTGTFDPAVAGVGTHEITYTTSGTCPDTDTMNIVVSAILDATITPAGPFCISESAVTLAAATTGGTWSGTGITNSSAGTFDPATAGMGTHEIIYTTSGTCGDADTVYITVVSQMDATIAAAGPYCENEAAVVLSAANAGGTWSGTGITNTSTGTFDPAVAGSGTHEIFYTISGNCGDVDSIEIIINDAPDFTYVATDESCTGALDGSITLTVTGGANPITYTWSTGDNTLSVTGIGEGSYSVTVTDAYGCTRNTTVTLGDPGVSCDDIHPHAVVPNAFSPNSDGENDVLYVRGEGVTQLSFFVYDRWGEKVFSTTNMNVGWDGTFRGKELDPAVFTYYLHVIFVDGTEKTEKGDVTLTR